MLRCRVPRGTPRSQLRPTAMAISSCHMLQRRRLMRALVRAGLPPFVRGYLWSRRGSSLGALFRSVSVTAPRRLCRWSGLLERESLGLLGSEDVGDRVEVELESPGSAPVVVTCQECGASAPPALAPVLPTPCIHALIPGIVPELVVPPPGLTSQLLQQQRNVQHGGAGNPPWAATPHPGAQPSRARCSYYDRCVLANVEALSSRPDGVPPRLQQLADCRRGAVAEWRGRVLCAAPPATVRQIDADLRRTTPHLWPIEAARVSWAAAVAPGGGRAPVAGGSSDPVAGLEVRYVFAPRASCWCRCELLAAPPDAALPSALRSCVCCDCQRDYRRVSSPAQARRASPGEPAAHRDGLVLQQCPSVVKCHFSFALQSPELVTPPTLPLEHRSGRGEAAARIVVSESACRRVLLAFATHNPSVDYCQVRYVLGIFSLGESAPISISES